MRNINNNFWHLKTKTSRFPWSIISAAPLPWPAEMKSCCRFILFSGQTSRLLAHLTEGLCYANLFLLFCLSLFSAIILFCSVFFKLSFHDLWPARWGQWFLSFWCFWSFLWTLHTLTLTGSAGTSTTGKTRNVVQMESRWPLNPS